MLAATPTQDSGAPTELLSQLAKGRAAGARFAYPSGSRQPVADRVASRDQEHPRRQALPARLLQQQSVGALTGYEAFPSHGRRSRNRLTGAACPGNLMPLLLPPCDSDGARASLPWRARTQRRRACASDATVRPSGASVGRPSGHSELRQRGLPVVLRSGNAAISAPAPREATPRGYAPALLLGGRTHAAHAPGRRSSGRRVSGGVILGERRRKECVCDLGGVEALVVCCHDDGDVA